MKKLTITLFAVMLLFGCSHPETRFAGSYSYKLSGETEIIDENGEKNVVLVSKNGQMNILRDKNNRSRLLVTMNEMNGSCYTISAFVRNDSIIFEPYTFSTNILTAGGLKHFDQDENTASIVYSINSEGIGTLTDDFLIVEESWSGCQSGNNNVTLSSNKIQILAERN